MLDPEFIKYALDSKRRQLEQGEDPRLRYEIGELERLLEECE